MIKIDRYDWGLLISIIVLAFLTFLLGFFFAMTMKGTIEADMTHGEIRTWDIVAKVACSSNSMGLTLNCKDKLFLRNITNKTMKEGRIYTFQNGNHSTAHRFITCLDEECNQLVFKGDANRRGEIINRSQILYEVVKTEYKK